MAYRLPLRGLREHAGDISGDPAQHEYREADERRDSLRVHLPFNHANDQREGGGRGRRYEHPVCYKIDQVEPFRRIAERPYQEEQEHGYGGYHANELHERADENGKDVEAGELALEYDFSE